MHDRAQIIEYQLWEKQLCSSFHLKISMVTWLGMVYDSSFALIYKQVIVQFNCVQYITRTHHILAFYHLQLQRKIDTHRKPLFPPLSPTPPKKKNLRNKIIQCVSVNQ